MWRPVSPEEFRRFHTVGMFLGCVNPDENLDHNVCLQLCQDLHTFKLRGNGFVTLKSNLRKSGLNYVVIDLLKSTDVCRRVYHEGNVCFGYCPLVRELEENQKRIQV